MAKKSSVDRNNKRIFLEKKYRERRKKLKSIIADPKSSDDEFFKAQRDLALLPRNASPVRVCNRCQVTGRARAYMRRFGLSRIAFREAVYNCELPGVTKSSW